jgi:AraC family transcriptional regulator
MINKQDSPRSRYENQIHQVVTYITDHLTENLDLVQLASISHFSPFHFHRIFFALMGETPQEYVNRLRLERAANLLIKAPELSITRIALQTGFSSSSTFARSFKKHYGISAKNYKRSQISLSIPEKYQPAADGEFAIPMTITIRVMPRLHLAYVGNMHGYTLNNICEAWNRLTRWAMLNDLYKPGTRMVGISFDDPLITPLEKCRYYACISVPEGFKADRRVGFLDIPEGKCAVGEVTCTAEQIEAVYHQIFLGWLPDSGYQPADYPCYEIYHETGDANSEGIFLMDVCIPILPI